MASIRKRGKVWRARYRDPLGKERARHFERRVDAQTWLDQVTADLVRDTYVDPRGGKLNFKAFADTWLAAQTFDESTREAVESRLRVHILPTFESMQLPTIRPSTVQAWLRQLQQELAPSYVRVLLANLSAILGAAVEDSLISRNPCASRAVRAPRLEDRKVQPWTHERVRDVVRAHPDRWRALPILAAGAGLRQGEAFGVRLDDIDFLGRSLHVRQQVKLLRGKPVIGLPKRGKTRAVPLADIVARALAESIRRFPPRADGLIFVTREGNPLARPYYNQHVWKPALLRAGVELARENGMHALRHYFASVQLENGVNIRALAEFLEHSDPGFTLRVYTHLMPASEGRARAAVDSALGNLADYSRTPRAEDA